MKGAHELMVGEQTKQRRWMGRGEQTRSGEMSSPKTAQKSSRAKPLLVAEGATRT